MHMTLASQLPPLLGCLTGGPVEGMPCPCRIALLCLVWQVEVLNASLVSLLPGGLFNGSPRRTLS